MAEDGVAEDGVAEDGGGRPAVWTGHLVVHGTDPARSSAFYANLGMRTVAVMGDVAVMELRGGTHLVVRKDPAARGAPAGFDLMVEDLDATHRAWASKGLAVSEITRDERGIHRIFTVSDPDGNAIVVNDSHVVGPV